MPAKLSKKLDVFAVILRIYNHTLAKQGSRRKRGPYFLERSLIIE